MRNQDGSFAVEVDVETNSSHNSFLVFNILRNSSNFLLIILRNLAFMIWVADCVLVRVIYPSHQFFSGGNLTQFKISTRILIGGILAFLVFNFILESKLTVGNSIASIRISIFLYFIAIPLFPALICYIDDNSSKMTIFLFWRNN